MGATNWIVQKTMRSEAKRVAKLVAKIYPETKAKMPNAAEADIIKAMVFTENDLAKFSQGLKDRIDVCCKTINGFCYMLVLDMGKLKGWMNFRSLQFTAYMDKELIRAGFSKQSLEQKKEILEKMDLAIDNWCEITGD